MGIKKGLALGFKEINLTLAFLTDLQPGCCEAVQSWQIPHAKQMLDPDTLPTSLGDLVFVEGKPLTGRLLDAMNDLARAKEEVAAADASIVAGAAAAQARLEALQAQLTELTLNPLLGIIPDVVAGSGPCGLVQADDSSSLVYAVDVRSLRPDEMEDYAVGIAFHVHAGVAEWTDRRDRLDRLRAGIRCLPANCRLILDAAKRPMLRLLAKQLLSGAISAHEWAKRGTRAEGPVEAEEEAAAAEEGATPDVEEDADDGDRNDDDDDDAIEAMLGIGVPSGLDDAARPDEVEQDEEA